MTTNATLTNKPYLAPQMPEKTVISLIKTTLWLGAIILLPQLILAFGFSLFFGIQQGGDFSADAFNLWFRSIPVLLTMSLIAPIISLPLLMLASDKDASKNNWSNLFAFCALKPITLSALAKYLGLGLLFWLLSSFIGELLGLPIEQFMLDIKIKEFNELSIDELCWNSQIPMNQISTHLMSLEFGGIIKNMPGKKYKLMF